MEGWQRLVNVTVRSVARKDGEDLSEDAVPLHFSKNLGKKSEVDSDR